MWANNGLCLSGFRKWICNFLGTLENFHIFPSEEAWQAHLYEVLMTKLRPSWRQFYCGDVYNSTDNLDTNCCQQCCWFWPWPKLWLWVFPLPGKLQFFLLVRMYPTPAEWWLSISIILRSDWTNYQQLGWTNMNACTFGLQMCVNPEALWIFLLTYFKLDESSIFLKMNSWHLLNIFRAPLKNARTYFTIF
jgi:hypothetical protein